MAAKHRKSFHWEGERRGQEPAQICSTTGKRMYGSEEEAKATAAHQMKTQQGSSQKGSVRLRVYLCLYCDAWHLTSKDA